MANVLRSTENQFFCRLTNIWHIYFFRLYTYLTQVFFCKCTVYIARDALAKVFNLDFISGNKIRVVVYVYLKK